MLEGDFLGEGDGGWEFNHEWARMGRGTNGEGAGMGGMGGGGAGDLRAGWGDFGEGMGEWGI